MGIEKIETCLFYVYKIFCYALKYFDLFGGICVLVKLIPQTAVDTPLPTIRWFDPEYCVAS